MTMISGFNLGPLLGVCGLLAFSCPVGADDAAPSGLISEYTGRDATDWLGLKGSGWTVGGWATAGIDYNTDSKHR